LMRTAVHDWWQFAAYLLVASIAARFRVSLPRMTSSMAVNLPFILIAVLELSLVEALTIAAVSTFVQCFWPESKKRNPVQMVFNVSVLVLSAYLTWMVSRLSYHNTALQITASAAMILFANTVPVAAIIAFSEEGSVWSTWKQIFLLTFPYYLVAAGLAALVKLADSAVCAAGYVDHVSLVQRILPADGASVVAESEDDGGERVSSSNLYLLRAIHIARFLCLIFSYRYCADADLAANTGATGSARTRA